MKLATVAATPGSAAADPFLVRVDARLHEELDAERARAGEVSAPNALLDELSRVLLAGGKRIRPLFCYWGYRAGGGADDQVIVSAGAAVEMLHTAALIHDDLVDGSRLRRGAPASFRALAAAAGGGDDAFGRSAAILAGDLAQALAGRMIVSALTPASEHRPDGPDSPRSSRDAAAALAAFDRMRIDAVRGEFLDLVHSAPASTTAPATEREIRMAGELKSGSYSVVGPLSIGAALAGAEPLVRDRLVAFGTPLGEAFQLRDDVLSTFGDPVRTGKDPDDDIREGKQTVLVAKARRLATEDDRRRLNELLGSDALTKDAADEVRRIVRTSGAFAETIALIDALAARARRALDPALLPPAVREALDALVDLVALRDG